MKKFILNYSNNNILIFLVIILYISNIQYVIAQISWDSSITVPLIDTILFNNRLNSLERNQNFLKVSNSTKQILQVVNTPDIAITNVNNITHSENSIFISPINANIMLNSNNFSTWPSISNLSTSGQTSNDGGLNWSAITVGNLNSSRADPATAIGISGRLFLGYIDLSFGQSISYSDDNGQTWIERQVAPNPGTVADKNHLWIDNSIISNFEGNLYSAWTDFGSLNSSNLDIVISLSTNDGDNWSAPVNISSDVGGCRDQGVNIQTGPNGEVYVCWAIYDNCSGNEAAIGFTKSLDGGQTWEEITAGITSERIQNINGHRITRLGGRNKTMRHNSFPVMTVNQQNGEIYIVWTQLVGVFETDIFMIKSSNNGDTWDTPIRVNQDVMNNGLDQWFPWIACDEVTGALVVIYYDSRNNNDLAETFVSISYDRGNTWEDFLISDNPWKGEGIPGFTQNYAGDYIGIDVSHGRVVPVWSSDHTGKMLAYTQPFSLPCPQDLELCNATITGDAVYKVANTITVGGPGCNYTVTSTGNVVMEAGTEIIFTGDVEITGNFIATINPACSSFGDAKLADPGPANINVTKDEPVTKIEYKKRDLEIEKYYFTKFYPNPASNLTNIEYIITNNCNVNISIYNASGNLVGNIVNNTNQPKGKYQIRFDAGNLTPGLYLCIIQTNEYTASHKFSVLNR